MRINRRLKGRCPDSDSMYDGGLSGNRLCGGDEYIKNNSCSFEIENMNVFTICFP